MKDKKVYVDGFNQLILLESLLSGAYVFKGTDGVYRDTSSIYGNYRLVNQTEEALFIIGTVLKKIEVKTTSNSRKYNQDNCIKCSCKCKKF